MSVLAILGGDWEIQFDDEKATSTPTVGLKMITHVSGTTVVTANALYSAIADAMDELQSMDDENPMLPTTPNAYTLENEYFMDDDSTQFVSGGAISSVNWTDEVLCKVVSGGTPFVKATDVGRQVIETASGDTGILLDVETLPDGTDVIWIRPEDPTPTTGDIFDSTTSTIEVTTDSGTGTRNCSVVATTGEQLWSNVNVIGGIDGDAANTAEVYVVQDRIKLTQWWTTDPTASGGIIDILVRMNNSLTAAFPVIALGIVEVFNRRYGSLYDNFPLDVSAGGTNSLPLATGPDLNNTTGYRNALWDAGTGSAMTVGDLITNTSQVGAFAVVTAVTDSGATGNFDYFLVGDLNDFVNDDTFTSVRSGTIMGAPTNATGGPTDSAAGQGGTVTVALGTTDVDHDGDGATEPYSITIDAQGLVSTEEVYERLKYITRRGATAADLFSVPTSELGETFSGLQGQLQYDAPSGTFNEGDDITNETVAAGIQAAIVLAVNVSATYLTVTDTSGAFNNDDVLDDESADSVTIMGAPTIITPVKQSPFGTFAGGTFFGARGVVLINPASGDEQDATLVDDNGTQRIPPNTVSVQINNLVDQDVVFVADDTGTAGIIDKDRFGGISGTPASGSTTLTVGGTIDTDVPQAGFIRVVDTNAIPIVEQRYRYSSRTSTVFTLVVPKDGVALTAGGSATSLRDSAATFLSDDIIFGDVVRQATNDERATVVLVVSDTEITTTTLSGGDSWTDTELYDIGTTVFAYTTADDIYAPILDRRVETDDSDSINNSLVQSGSFGIIINVRQGKIILPFTQNSTVEAAGRSLDVIRNIDTIAT